MAPILLGLGAAVVVILISEGAVRLMRSPRYGHWFGYLLYGTAALGFTAGIVIETRLGLRIGYALIVLINAYAILATAFQWPGFRPPPAQDEEDDDAEP